MPDRALNPDCLLRWFLFNEYYHASRRTRAMSNLDAPKQRLALARSRISAFSLIGNADAPGWHHSG
jgi:hypothetical protein